MNKVNIKENKWKEMKLVQKWVDMTDEDIARTLGNLKERRRWLRRRKIKNRKSVIY
jgi:hypothetical protein